MPDLFIHYGFSILVLLSLRRKPKESLLLGIAGILPDFDVFLHPFIIHRSVTHSFLVIWAVFGFLLYLSKNFDWLDKYHDYLVLIPILMSIHVFFDMFDWYVAIFWPLDFTIFIQIALLGNVTNIGVLDLTFNVFTSDLSILLTGAEGYIFWDFSTAFLITVFILVFINWNTSEN